MIFWPCFTGLTILVIGLFSARKELSAARGMDKLLVLGPVFFAAPLALFGAEHLAGAEFIKTVVPPWMPGRLFWVYFVGCALIVAAFSIVLSKRVRLSATLLGAMFFLFVLMIHIPNVVAHPENRFLWAVALRDLSFAGGALALAATQGSKPLIGIARFCVAVPLIFFSVEYFLHPEFVPGVPLQKLTPDWVPLRAALGYITGAALLVAGTLTLVKKHARMAAATLGLLIALEVLVLYMPILVLARGDAALTEGQNYVADTLLFGGAILLLAAAMSKDNPAGEKLYRRTMVETGSGPAAA
jgi:uncharacterized membrane protein